MQPPGVPVVGVWHVLDVTPLDLWPPIDISLMCQPVTLVAWKSVLELNIFSCQKYGQIIWIWKKFKLSWNVILMPISACHRAALKMTLSLRCKKWPENNHLVIFTGFVLTPDTFDMIPTVISRPSTFVHKKLLFWITTFVDCQTVYTWLRVGFGPRSVKLGFLIIMFENLSDKTSPQWKILFSIFYSSKDHKEDLIWSTIFISMRVGFKLLTANPPLKVIKIRGLFCHFDYGPVNRVKPWITR